MNTAEIVETVRSRYGAFAAGAGQESCCAATAGPGSGYAADFGLYGRDELAAVPAEAVSLSRGCGNPTGFAGLEPGEAVVDLGCGAGIDALLAAGKVGNSGRVIGVDVTPEMIQRAQQHAGQAESSGPMELRVADLVATGLPDGCADVVISNCVINLCPDKAAVYREAFRLLRPGGRLAISDVMLTEDLPAEWMAPFHAAWLGCLGGAIAEKEYFATVRDAGFDDLSVVSEHTFAPNELEEMACCPGAEFTPRPADTDLAAVQDTVTSIKFTARKGTPLNGTSYAGIPSANGRNADPARPGKTWRAPGPGGVSAMRRWKNPVRSR